MVNHINFTEILNYLRDGKYPEKFQKDKGKKANFRKGVKNFTLVDGQMFYKNTRLVIISRDEQLSVIKDIHAGLGKYPHSKALASHRGRDATYEKIIARFYWHNIMTDVDTFIKECEQCQKQGTLKVVSTELHSIPVKSEVMQQISVDLCNLPEVDGFKHLIVSIDYFIKWSEAKPIKDKTAPTVAQFLYELVCRHGCIKIQINDQGREFVNEMSKELHRMTGTEQRVASAYHPQANGLCERQNRTIKDALVKALDENPENWPTIIEGILFAHRVSRHAWTKYSPFYLLYNREPTLPIDIKYNLVGEEEPFDRETFDSILSRTITIREGIHQTAGENIKAAQKKQKRDYDRRHQVPNVIRVGERVLLKNLKREDRKGGKFTHKWVGPYIVNDVNDKNLCSLTNNAGKKLKMRYNVSLLKLYVEATSFTKENGNNEIEDDENINFDAAEQQPAHPPDETPAHPPDEKPVHPPDEKPAHPPDEKPAHPPDEKDTITSAFTVEMGLSKLPNEIVIIILEKVVQRSDDPVSTFNHLTLTCTRFNALLQRYSQHLLPRVYIKFKEKDYEGLSKYNGKIKISVRKIVKLFGQLSGVSLRISEIVNNRKWKSSWLVLEREELSWYRISKVYWKSKKGSSVPNLIVIDDGDDEAPSDEKLWIRNELYLLEKEDFEILHSKTAWLNDRIMYAAQRLICETLGDQNNYQSLLNTSKNTAMHFQPVYQDHIQLLHDGGSHWFLSEFLLKW